MPSMWPNTLGRFVQSWLSAGGGVAVATITSNRVLDGTSAQVQQITASGGNRNILLPPIAKNGFGNGQVFWVQNAGSSNNVLVKDSAGTTTVATLTPGDWAMVVSYGSTTTPTWAVPVSTTGLTSITLSGALTAASAVINGSLSAVAAAFTGAVTTTDGVTSGPVRKVGGLVSTKTSSTTLTNSTAETVIATYTLPANTLKAGTVLRIRGGARVSGVTGTPNAAINVRIGGLTGTVIASSGGVAVIGNDVLTADMLVSSRVAPSAASALVSEGVARWTASGVGGQKPFLSASTNAATNGALDLVLTGQWDAASSSNIMVGEAFVIEVVG